MRVLFLTHRLPYAPNRGDRIRSYHMLRTLAAHAEVELVSLVHDREEQSRADDIRELASITTLLVPRLRNRVRAIGALAGRQALTHALLDAPAMGAALDRIMNTRPPDVVFAYCSGMARFALGPPLARVPFVLDMVDVDSEKWRALATHDTYPGRWIHAREARCLARFETVIVGRAHATLVVNERERANITRLIPDANVHVVPNGVDVDAFRPTGAPADNARVVFCGVMNYRPNVDAALWLAREIWPLVRARRPDARLLLLGSAPTREIRALAVSDHTIEISGFVQDVRPALWLSAVSVAPLFIARGIQNKVLEAVAAGLPSVVTPHVFEGLPSEVAAACVVAPTTIAFAGKLIDLLDRTPAERRAVAHRANLSSLIWSKRLAGVVPLLEAVLPKTLTNTRLA